VLGLFKGPATSLWYIHMDTRTFLS
jgi:hypothetical protein